MRPRRRRRDRQPLDIGIPAADNTHEVAQGIASETRMVHVDYDPVVPAHARALLTNTEEGATEYIDADLHGTGTIPAWAVSLLDFSRPVAVTLLAVPHAIPDADAPYAIVARLMDAVPPGSYLAISHGASDLLDQETWKSIGGSRNGRVQQQFIWRSRDQVARFFAGADLVEPGLVPVEEWRPELDSTDTAKSAGWGAVGRKR